MSQRRERQYRRRLIGPQRGYSGIISSQCCLSTLQLPHTKASVHIMTWIPPSHITQEDRFEEGKLVSTGFYRRDSQSMQYHKHKLCYKYKLTFLGWLRIHPFMWYFKTINVTSHALIFDSITCLVMFYPSVSTLGITCLQRMALYRIWPIFAFTAAVISVSDVTLMIIQKSGSKVLTYINVELCVAPGQQCHHVHYVAHIQQFPALLHD